jgi:hypothetical protein
MMIAYLILVIFIISYYHDDFICDGLDEYIGKTLLNFFKTMIICIIVIPGYFIIKNYEGIGKVSISTDDDGYLIGENATIKCRCEYKQLSDN